MPFLLPFLTIQWREVMARAWKNQAVAPSDWEDALGTMDQVIWSTQPKGSGAERARLVAVLPDLVRKLNASLDTIGWSGEERTGFMRSLIDTHMKAIRTPKTGPAPLESGPGEGESRAGSEAMKALEHRRTRHQAGEADEFDAMAQAFTRAMWFEFADDKGVRRRYRLSWVSPQRTRLLFTNRDGFEAFVRSEKEVGGLLRLIMLVVLLGGLFGQQRPALEQAVREFQLAKLGRIDGAGGWNASILEHAIGGVALDVIRGRGVVQPAARAQFQIAGVRLERFPRSAQLGGGLDFLPVLPALVRVAHQRHQSLHADVVALGDPRNHMRAVLRQRLAKVCRQLPHAR